MTQLPRLTSIRLRVHDLDKLTSYYEDVVGLQRQQTSSGRVVLGASPESASFVTLEESVEAPERPRSAAGLFHLAIRLPSRRALSQALRRIEAAGHRLTGASDHRVSQALYLRDPEGNGVEIYWDRPKEAWPTDSQGRVRMDTLPLDLDDLRAEADEFTPRVPNETDLGHVHLEVTELSRMGQFCQNVLGMNVRMRHRGALFLAWGDYHHHIAANTWRNRNQPAPSDASGLTAIGATLPSEAAVTSLVKRARDAEGVKVEVSDRLVTLIGPDGIRWEFTGAG